jgi:hypothetical protein
MADTDIMAGGHHFMMTPPSDALIAYALPDTEGAVRYLHQRAASPGAPGITTSTVR